MSNAQIISVTFEIDVQNWAPQFSVPVDVCRLLGIEKRDVALTMRDSSGDLLFEGLKTVDALALAECLLLAGLRCAGIGIDQIDTARN